MTCNNCKCGASEPNEPSECNCKDTQEEIKEFVPNTEYPVGSFFRVDKEVFKVALSSERRCDSCDFLPEEYDQCCGEFKCSYLTRNDRTQVVAILYDSEEDTND